MRILYSHRVQSRDGQGVHIEELVSAFRRAGHEILLVGPVLYERASFGGESRFVPIIRRWLPRALLEVAELIYNVPAFLQLQKTYRRFKPNFVYERYNLYYLAGTLLKRWYRVPFYLEVNSPIAEERARFSGLLFRRLAAALERSIWRAADRVFVVTEVLKQLVVDAGVANERISVVPNGVDAEAFTPEPYQARPDGPIKIGFVGFVRDWHGLDAVISGLAAERGGPPIHLVVAGDGPARSTLERQAAALGVARLVRFIGLQQRQAIPALIREFDIALQPRVVDYASPLKIFEYMASGRAIVAPDQPNIREILADGETAVLFDPDEPGALWRAIRRLAADPKLRERLGRAARRALDVHDYTWQSNAARIMAMVSSDFRDTVQRPLDRIVPP